MIETEYKTPFYKSHAVFKQVFGRSKSISIYYQNCLKIDEQCEKVQNFKTNSYELLRHSNPFDAKASLSTFRILRFRMLECFIFQTALIDSIKIKLDKDIRCK